MANLLSNTTIGGYQSIHTGNIGSYAVTSIPANVITTSGGQTIGGITYFSNAESLNVYGIRGRFTNEYMHLYNKVGIGHPSGWGQGEGNTPGHGLSTYGGINIAYGYDGGATINTYTRINKNWGGGDYGTEAFTIRGTYPSITLRSTNHDSKWLIHHASELQFYYGASADSNVWSNVLSITTNGNLYMAWAGGYISDLLNAKQNASTAITTSNIGSQSVSYAITAGALSSMNISQFTNNSGYITGYTETDTLNSVTTRGASTTNDITIGGLTVSGSLTYGTFPSASNYVIGADNIVLKGNSGGVSGIFFESEKNGTNINHPSDFGFIQYHAYGIGGSSGESNRLVIGISNDGDDIIVLNPVTSNGLVVRVGAGTTEYVVYHSGNIPTWNQNTTGSAGSLSNMNISQFTNNSGYVTSSSLSSYLPLAGGTMTGKILSVSTGSGTYDTAIEIREQGYVTTSQSAWGYSPAMTFHWGGRYAVRFGLRSDGLMAVDDAPIALRSWVSAQGFITGYTETDTLASVTGRGNTTSNSVRFGTHVDLSPTGSAFRFYDGTTFRGGFGTDAWGHSGSDANLVLYVNGDNTLFFSTAGTKRASLSSSAFNSLVALQQSGNQVLHAGNYTSYSPSLTGSGASGTWSINVTGSAGSAPNGSNSNQFYDVNAGVGNGLRFWNGSSAYKISMGVGALYQYGPVTDYSIKAQMNDGDTGRGFTWGRESYAPIAALNSTSGDMQIAGSLRAAGHLFTSYNGSNILLRSADNTSDAGILVQNSGGTFKFQIYGNGGDYGFLNGNWAGWDIRKTISGAMYMNGDSTYYLYTNGTSNFYALNIQGNAVVHAGNIGSQSVSNASTVGGYTAVQLYTTNSSYLGGYYVSGGTELPNSATFGAGKLKLAMLSGGNLGFGGSWNDVLWLSAYTGGDVKSSHALVFDKYSTNVWVSDQNFDSGSWGTGYLLLSTANYTSYAPSLTGSGASGSWGISVTGSAGSVAWTNVSSRPTALSQFTNDLGNYGGFLTSITAHTHAISDVTGLQTALDGKQAAGSYAASSHTHDDRYYTESESDTRFARRDADSAISGNLVIGNGTYGNSTAYGSSGARLMFSGSDTDAQNNYYIGTNHNDYGGNYSKLELRWHTGIRMGAQPGYGGIRFYDTEDLGTVIFSVGTGDSHVRVVNNLYVGGNLALHAGNYNSYSPTLTGGNASGTWSINVTGSAGSAGSVAWTNVSSRPTNLSQFTNDLGNYGGWQSASTAITTSNIGSQSVSYASTAGSAPANGGNSSTVGGYAVSGSVGANTVVIRDSNGYIYAHYINSNVSESENPTINSFYTSNGDGWLRKSSVAHVKSQLGLGSLAYSSATIPTNNNQLTNGAGYITGINSGNVTTALGFTPYNATNPSGYITSSASISGNAATATNVAWTGVTGRPTALSQFSNDLGNYGGWLTTGGKAADSELFDGTDSIYFVKGNGTNALGRTTTNNSGGNSAGGLSSGFYDGSGMSNMPTSDWYHLIVNSHHNSATSNQYEFQLATAFWDKSNFYVRSISPGDVGPWRTLVHNGNIGSQSVSYATTSQQLNKYGDISGQDWNTYYINGKMIVSSVYGGSGPNFPTGAYNYGAMLSYGVTGSEFFQVYFPENGALQGGAFRKLHYRTGWNGSWSAWKSVVDQEGQVCTIAGSNQTGIEIHSNVGYNQDPLTYFLMRGQADTSWKALKVRLTGDAGGQDIEFRRIAENGTDARMWYIPRGANTVNFEYPIVQPSDSRLKDNLTPITNPVDKIKSLRGVEFDWNSGEQVGTHDVGLIAQDVEAVLPEAVTTQEDGYKNLAYTKVIPLLVEAMKEQQTMIEALRAEIELLKNK